MACETELENEEQFPSSMVQTLRAEFDICTGRLREKILSLEHYYCKAAGAQAMLEPLSEPVGSTVARELLRNSTSGSVGVRSQTLTDGTRSFEVFEAGNRRRSWNQEMLGAGASASSVSTGEPPALLEHRLRSQKHNPLRRFIPTGAIHSVRALNTEVRLHNRWLQLSMQCDNAVAMTEFRSATKPGSSDRLTKAKSELAVILIKSLHPGGRLRLCWDTVAILLLFLDAIILPLSLAWDWQKGSADTGSMMLLGLFVTGCAFWTLDIFLNFNTSYFDHGTLITSRRAISRHYLSTWFLIDVALVVLDYLTMAHIFLEDMLFDLTLTRFARVLRIARLARLVKAARIEGVIQEYAASSGRQWVVLMVTFLNTMILGTLAQHMASCFWFWLGSSTWGSWIELADAGENSAFVQYLHSFRYVMLPLHTPAIKTDSMAERTFDIMYTGFWFVLLGLSISRIVMTFAELSAMNEFKSVQRRETLRYLRSQEASFELVARVMNFVDYKLEKLSMINFDTSLISDTLQSELCVNQRSRYLEALPICKICKDLFADIFATLCTVLKKMVVEQGEDVYVVGGWSTCLYISISGSYVHVDGLTPDAVPEEFTGINYFEELSLYVDALPHFATLHAKSFAEMYALEGNDLVKCLEKSPGCAGMFFEYARELTHSVQNSGGRLDRKGLQDLAEKCCKTTAVYQEIFPDEKFNLKNITATLSSSHEVLHSAADEHATDLRNIAWLLKEGWLEDLEESTLPTQLRSSLMELHPDTGSHVIFEQPQERDRAESSCISVLALVANRYEIYTRPQEHLARLRREQWESLQEMINWVRPTLDEIHSVLVLLAIRSLGKSKFVMCQVPSHIRRPESALLYLVDYRSNVVPSIKDLSEHGLACVRATLRIHEAFNFAQMLQGENVPANVHQLQVQVMREGEQAIRFYILFMSGLEGGCGSRFMTAQHAESVIEAIGWLQHLRTGTPRGIYWGYLCARGRALKLPQETPEDLVLLRLSLLMRIELLELPKESKPETNPHQSYANLVDAWNGLGEVERRTLTNHFLADGIDDVAFVLEYLPDCVVNSIKNPTVTLTVMLETLEELLHTLQPPVAMNPDLRDAKVIPVDLSDMSEFIKAVQNHFVFKTCLSRCKIRFVGRRAQLEMTGGNWGRIHEQESDLSSLAYSMRDIAHRQQALESNLLGLAKRSFDPLAPTVSI